MVSNIHLVPTLTIAQGMQAIILNCISNMDTHTIGVMQGVDSKSVHNMRVGLRRLRSVLTLLKKIAPLPETLQAELNWLQDELSPARDWDVLSTSTLPALSEKFSNNAEFIALHDAVAKVAHDKRIAAAKAVSSDRYHNLMQLLSNWARDCWGESSEAQQSKVQTRQIKKFADKTIRKLRRKLLRSGKNLGQLDPDQRHHVRIAAKKVRYATECFSSLYSLSKTRKFIQRLSKLQERLGRMNDTRVAGNLLQYIKKNHAKLADVSDFAYDCLLLQDELQYPKLKKLWKKFGRAHAPL
ncbi:MAG: CHAD domain-containing protein [Burkholderiaceae bacterium]